MAGNVVTSGLQAAAAAAERARASAEAARAQADSAQASAAAVARELLTSKRAEIEAAELLEKAKNPKDADPAAAEILKVGRPIQGLTMVIHMFHPLQSPSICHAWLCVPAWLAGDPGCGQLLSACSGTSQVLWQALLHRTL